MIDTFYALIAIFGGLIGLIFSSNFFIDGCASLSRLLGMSTTMIGLTVVAFGTSAPEIIVSIESARDGVPGLAIGNAIGSNIANIGLVLGITAIITNMKASNNLLAINIINPIYKSRLGQGIWLLIVTFISAFFTKQSNSIPTRFYNIDSLGVLNINNYHQEMLNMIQKL